MSRVNMPEFLPSLNQRASGARWLIFFALLAFGPMGIAGQAAQAPVEDKDVLDKMILNPTLKTFVNLIAKADMIETLKSESPFTIFAPNDAAFNKLPPGLMKTVKKDKAILKKFLTYQITVGRFESKDFKDGAIKTMEGEIIKLEVKKGLKLNGGKFVSIDEKAANGIIHTVDTVSFPPSMGRAVAKASFPGT